MGRAVERGKGTIKMMTVKELSELYHLEREINMHAGRLAAMDMDSCTEDSTDLKRELEEKIKRLITKQERLTGYIEDIPDSLTRTIFTLRFVGGLDNKKTAEWLGGEFTAGAVQARIKRYLKQQTA